MTDSIQWFYVDTEDGESKGPITTDQVKQLPSDTYVWNGSTVNEWTELKNTQLLPNQSIISNTQIEQEYDCQYMSDEIIEQQSDINKQTTKIIQIRQQSDINKQSDANEHTNQQIAIHNINDNNENKINDNVTKPSNNKLNLMTLAALSQLTNDTDEEIIDEELTPEPTNIMMNIPTNIMMNIPKNIIEKSDNKNNEIKVNKSDKIDTNELCIDTSKKIDNRINNKCIFSPDMPLQNLENNSLPKPFDNSSSNYIIHKIPKQGNKQIIAQPPSASSFKKNTNLQTQNEQIIEEPKNIIECPLCTFHNDINAIQCEMCLHKFKLDLSKMAQNNEIKPQNQIINVQKMNQKPAENNMKDTQSKMIQNIPKNKPQKQMKNMKQKKVENKNNINNKQSKIIIQNIPKNKPQNTDKQMKNMKQKQVENKNNIKKKQCKIIIENKPQNTEKQMKNININKLKNINKDIKKMNELDKQLEELMNNLEIPNTARISIRKLPKDKKIQMINQYQKQMKNSNNCDKKQKKEKKNSLFKKNKKKRDSQSNKDYIYIFKDSNNKPNNKPLTVNIDDMIDQRLTNNIEKNTAHAKKQIEKSNSIQTEHKQKQISVYDGYIKKYNKSPQNATQLMKFSKLKNDFKPLTFKQAKNILNEQKQQNKSEKKKNVSTFWGKKKAKKVDENVDIFVPTMPRAVTAPIQVKKQVTQTIKKQTQTVKKIKSIWDINENEGDDPMGSTYRKKVIINNYNKSKIIEQTVESVMKDKMGIISPETVQMKSVFDESSSDEDDDDDENRLTVNLKHAKHNKVSSHVDVKL